MNFGTNLKMQCGIALNVTEQLDPNQASLEIICCGGGLHNPSQEWHGDVFIGLAPSKAEK
jgi:hypothetical protein